MLLFHLILLNIVNLILRMGQEYGK